MSFNPADNPLVTLNNGQQIPQLGLGVYKVQQDVAFTSSRRQLNADTAASTQQPFMTTRLRLALAFVAVALGVKTFLLPPKSGTTVKAMTTL